MYTANSLNTLPTELYRFPIGPPHPVTHLMPLLYRQKCMYVYIYMDRYIYTHIDIKR